MGIPLSKLLELKDDALPRAIKMKSLGATELWSADTLYRHLVVLESLVPRTNPDAGRLWIDAFFYRVAAMIQEDAHMVLNIKRNASPATPSSKSPCTISGYAAITTSALGARKFLTSPSLCTGHLKENDSVLFVSEAKSYDQHLESHIEQAVEDIYSSAKDMGRKDKPIRGILTNGAEWIFIILKFINFPSYYISEKIGIHDIQASKKSISKESVSLISAIIARWIRDSDVGPSDDYFFKIE